VVFAIVVSRLIPSSNRILLYSNPIRTNDYVYEHLANLPPIDETPDDAQLETLDFATAIDIKNLSFGYAGQRRDVLSDLTLRIGKGETIGIVGPSGSGKTTLLSVLLRLFDESDGGIYVDGVKVGAQNRDSWYKLIGFVPQNINLLDDDFLHNVAFGVPDDKIDFEKAKESARRAELLELIEQSPNGFQTQIGESGIKISGGQRQRIGIARALYTDAQILIFDEATSQLDLKTEEQITESIRSLSHKDLTIVIVAHRLQTLRYCDSIYRIENGRLSPKLEYADLLKA
jgi:ABC-type multidrug transport system fused ATPase/permease subunit